MEMEQLSTVLPYLLSLKTLNFQRGKQESIENGQVGSYGNWTLKIKILFSIFSRKLSEFKNVITGAKIKLNLNAKG